MTVTDRWMLAITIVLLDAILFAIPLTGLLVAWVVVARPQWFRIWVERLYRA